MSPVNQPEASEHPLGVLRHFHFRNVISAGFVSNVGTWTEFFAIQMFVAQATGRLDDQGVLGVCQQAPIFALGLFGGLAADRVNRRTLLVVTQMLAGLVAVAVAIVTMIHFQNPRTAVHWLFALGAVNGCVMAFNFPAWQVLTPRLVPKEELGKAITLTGIQFNMARVIGPAIAGYVLASFGWTPLLWFNAATFLLMSMVIMTTPDAPVVSRAGEPVLPQIKEALSFLLHQRGPRAILLAQVLLSLLAAPLVRLLSNFIIDVYQCAGDTAERIGGNMLAVQGLGAVLGGICLRFIPKWYPKHHFIPMAVTGLGLSISLFALTKTSGMGYLAMFVCGWFWIWAFNQSWAAMQVITPDHLRGRALSLVTVAAFGATAVGVFVAGMVGEHLKVSNILAPQLATQTAILMLSVPLSLAGVVMMSFRVPEVDGMPRIKRGEPGASGKSRSLVEAVIASEHRPRGSASTAVEVSQPMHPEA